jgi:hypothetical protein
VQDPSDEERVRELASALSGYAYQDEQFASELADWARRYAPVDSVTQNVRAGMDAYFAGRDVAVQQSGQTDKLLDRVVASRYEKARLAADRGDTAEAERLLRDVLETLERVVGSEHPLTLAARREIARMMAANPRSYRITGAERDKLAVDLVKRYQAGESIRALAEATGRSYGFIHRILIESGVSLRGETPTSGSRSRMPVSPGIQSARAPKVSMYLSTDDDETINHVVQCVDKLVDYLGYDGPFSVEIEKGSFIRRSFAVMKKSLTSTDVADRLTKVERALELHSIDVKQVEVDEKAAKVVAELMGALQDVPSACIKVGSTLLIKYERGDRPVVLSRQLSQLELRAWEKFPEIQKEPSKAIEALSLAIEGLAEPESKSG